MPNEWFFPSTGGGQQTGLNDAGIEFFRAASSLARETIQNVGDARTEEAAAAGAPAVVRFELLELGRDQVPGLQGLRDVLERAQQRLHDRFPTESLRAQNGGAFFARALEMCARPTVPVLRIRDLNTTGLDGHDDDETSPWFRLIRGQGFSSRQGPGGGTFGIGQRAPFAFSAIRSVFYYTRRQDNTQAFMGKAILCSFPDADGDIRQGIGWYGDHPGPARVAAITEAGSIPGLFRREEVGTDVYVLGYERPSWRDEIRTSVLQHFFAAIHDGFLRVEISDGGDPDEIIDKDTLGGLLLEAASKARQSSTTKADRDDYARTLGATVFYLRALEHQKPVVGEVKGLGQVRLYVVRDPDAPARIVYMRQPRIVVYERTRRILPDYAAVVLVDNEEGNHLLADMEDPSHTRWDPDQLAARGPDDVRRARRALQALNRFVHTQLQELARKEQMDTEDFPDLSRYLPADDGSADEDDKPTALTTEATDASTDTETGLVRPRKKESEVKVTSQRTENTLGTGSMTATVDRPEEDDDDEPDEQDRDDDDDDDDGEEDGDGGGGGGGGGSDSNSHEDTETRKRFRMGDKQIRFRAFAEPGAAEGTYTLVLHGQADAQGDLQLGAVGESGGAQQVRIMGAWTEDGSPIELDGSRLKDLAVHKGERRVLKVKVDTPVRLSLTVEG